MQADIHRDALFFNIAFTPSKRPIRRYLDLVGHPRRNVRRTTHHPGHFSARILPLKKYPALAQQ